MKTFVTEREPDCTAYEVWETTAEPNTLIVREIYTSQQAVDAHRATPHFKDVIEDRVFPLLGDRSREFYEPVIL